MKNRVFCNATGAYEQWHSMLILTNRHRVYYKFWEDTRELNI